LLSFTGCFNRQQATGNTVPNYSVHLGNFHEKYNSLELLLLLLLPAAAAVVLALTLEGRHHHQIPMEVLEKCWRKVSSEYIFIATEEIFNHHPLCGHCGIGGYESTNNDEWSSERRRSIRHTR